MIIIYINPEGFDIFSRIYLSIKASLNNHTEFKDISKLSYSTIAIKNWIEVPIKLHDLCRRFRRVQTLKRKG